jgi:uncharacterized membrane protein YfcA
MRFVLFIVGVLVGLVAGVFGVATTKLMTVRLDALAQQQREQVAADDEG